MTLVNAFGDIALDQSVQDVKDVLETGASTNPENIVGKFRDAFQSFEPGTNWVSASASGDLIMLDGNALSSSYLAISKDPLSASGVSSIETISEFSMPVEISVGLSMSQRVLGQELSMELISTEDPLSPSSDIEISTISQTTTTLTVNTSTAHNLVPGIRIGIYGVPDSRFNYPSLVVASIPTPTQFTVTAGPAGTIPSITAGPFSGGYVYLRSTLGSAQNGISQIFENATVTNSSLYQRAASGDALSSGTVTGNHSVTTGTTNGTQTVSPFTYAWFPTTEYRIVAQADKTLVYDSAIDSAALPSARQTRTQVVPDPTKQYKLRFRFTNNKGLTVPVAKIVSATKSGSTTATIVTDSEHGLTTGDQIVIYGIRNQTSFANLTTATFVASVVSPTSFTIAFGASATAVSYGGMVVKVQGGNIPGSFTTIAAQSATNDGTFLTLIGSGNWAWLIGNYVNVYGLRNNIDGSDLGVDGVYKVASVTTTTMVLQPIGDTVLPESFATTECGGTVIRRTDLRISFVRVFDYLRQRVEVLNQPNASTAIPIVATAAISSAQSGTWTVQPGNTANTTPWFTRTILQEADIHYQSQNTFWQARGKIT
jgi:hypothetical protein